MSVSCCTSFSVHMFEPFLLHVRCKRFKPSQLFDYWWQNVPHTVCAHLNEKHDDPNHVPHPTELQSLFPALLVLTPAVGC